MFTLPKGRGGKLFVKEMTDLINSWCNKSEWRGIAMKALMIIPSLLLQKPSPKSKSHVNKHHLKRRITLWQNGKIDDLLREAAAIQYRLKSSTRTISVEERSRKFANFVINGNHGIHGIHGNINGALLNNAEIGGSGVLPINDYIILYLCYVKNTPKVSKCLMRWFCSVPEKMLNL